MFLFDIILADLRVARKMGSENFLVYCITYNDIIFIRKFEEVAMFEITCKLTDEDYLKFNEHHMLNSVVGRKNLKKRWQTSLFG